MAPYYLISDVYDRNFKYYRTPRVFAVEIRKYHQKNPLEKFYEIEQCKIAINYKLAYLNNVNLPYHTIYNKLEECKQCITKPYLSPNITSAPFNISFWYSVLFETQSNTLFRVLFSSLYLQFCMFYFPRNVRDTCIPSDVGM